MRTSKLARDKLKQLEGFRGDAYLCPAGVWTIGYGFTEGVKQGDTITQSDADVRLISELVWYEDAVWVATGGSVTQTQFDAMVLFAFNIGVSAFQKSSVIKAHVRGDFVAAAKAFGLWNKATVNGKLQPLAGLTRRRAEEAALYLADETESTPQAVEPEKPMGQSTINKASVVAGGTAAIVTATETVNSINSLKTSVNGLGDWLLPALLVVTLCAIGYIVWERFQMRNRGVA